MKPCPFCAEPIQDAAIKCKHCGSMLSDTAAASPTDTLDAAQTIQADSPSQTPNPYDTLDLSRTIQPGQIAPGMLLAGQYRIEQRLGSGGMGEVWKATDTELDSAVAVKVLPAMLSRDATAIANLKREALIGQQLTHAGICRLYGFHSSGETKFLVMEYVPGKTLAELLVERDDRKMNWEELKPLAEQIAEALDYAHGASYTNARGKRVRGVLHRDIKPQNIMVTPDGVAKLMDFGIAREIHNSMTQVTGRTSQTPLYASPEQFRGEHLTPASDVYSFAAVLYECLAGVPRISPHGDLGWQILQKPFEPLSSVPDEVNSILRKGLERDTAVRPTSAKALLAKSGAPQKSPPASPRPPHRESRPQPPIGRTSAVPSSRRAESSSVRATPKASSHSGGSGVSHSGSESLSAGSSFGAGKWLAVALVLAGLLGLYAFLNDSGSADNDSPDSVVSSVYEEEDAADSSPDWPFTSTEARRRQSQTAKALGLTSTTRTLRLPGGETLELVLIPAGTFTMGSPEGEGDSDEHPQRTVTISKPFWLGKTEVTQAQYEAVTGKSPWKGKTAKENPQHAANYVSWNDATAFCKALSQTTKQTVRLPTEAEWEYACRAGSEEAYSFGDYVSKLGDYAWFRSNAYDENEKYAHPVGKKKSNAWGLHDMHGNVWEWCNDWFQDSYKGLPAKDPKGPKNGNSRVLRGGCWDDVAWICRSANRGRYAPVSTFNNIGVRVVVDFK